MPKSNFIKANEDAFATQLITYKNNITADAPVGLWSNPVSVMVG